MFCTFQMIHIDIMRAVDTIITHTRPAIQIVFYQTYLSSVTTTAYRWCYRAILRIKVGRSIFHLCAPSMTCIASAKYHLIIIDAQFRNI